LHSKRILPERRRRDPGRLDSAERGEGGDIIRSRDGRSRSREIEPLWLTATPAQARRYRGADRPHMCFALYDLTQHFGAAGFQGSTEYTDAMCLNRGMVVVVRTEEEGYRPQQINSNSTMGLCTVLHCRVGPAFGLRDNVHRSGDGLGQN